MSRLIEYANAIDKIYTIEPENDGSDGCTVIQFSRTFTSEEIEALLDELPTIDPVHAAGGVYCRECCFQNTLDCPAAPRGYTSALVKYCSYGKPKEAQDDGLQ